MSLSIPIAGLATKFYVSRQNIGFRDKNLSSGGVRSNNQSRESHACSRPCGSLLVSHLQEIFFRHNSFIFSIFARKPNISPHGILEIVRTQT